MAETRYRTGSESFDRLKQALTEPANQESVQVAVSYQLQDREYGHGARTEDSHSDYIVTGTEAAAMIDGDGMPPFAPWDDSAGAAYVEIDVTSDGVIELSYGRASGPIEHDGSAAPSRYPPARTAQLDPAFNDSESRESFYRTLAGIED